MYSTILISDDNGGLKFAQDTEGNWGYITPGADTVNPFSSSNNEIIISGQLIAYTYYQNSTV